MKRTAEQQEDDALPLALRIAVTVAVVIAACLLTGLAAPGIDVAALGGTGYIQLDTMAASHISILALKFTPVITALMVFELLRLLLPGAAKWQTGDETPNPSVTRNMLILAFVLAALQGWGVARALDDFGNDVVPNHGAAFQLGFAVSQVAGTAVLVLLADLITRYGIGSGFWVMTAAFELAAIPFTLVHIFSAASQGLIDTGWLIALAGIIVAGGSALLAFYRRGIALGRSARQSAADIILPPFLGVSAGTFVYGLTFLPRTLLLGENVTQNTFAGDAPLRFVIVMAAIAGVAYLRLRSNAAHALRIAAVNIALLLAFELIAGIFGTPILRIDTLAIVVAVGALALTETKTRRSEAGHP